MHFYPGGGCFQQQIITCLAPWPVILVAKSSHELCIIYLCSETRSDNYWQCMKVKIIRFDALNKKQSHGVTCSPRMIPSFTQERLRESRDWQLIFNRKKARDDLLVCVTAFQAVPSKTASVPRTSRRKPGFTLFPFMWRIMQVSECHIKILTAVFGVSFALATIVKPLTPECLCSFQSAERPSAGSNSSVNAFRESKGSWIFERWLEALKYANTVLYPSTCCNKGWQWSGLLIYSGKAVHKV